MKRSGRSRWPKSALGLDNRVFSTFGEGRWLLHAGGRELSGLGANRVAGALRTAAAALQRSKTALGASFRRVARRKGAAVAVFATARQLAKLIYRMLRFGQDYVDVGEQAYERQFQLRRLASITEAARSLGFTLVEQTPEPAAG